MATYTMVVMTNATPGQDEAFNDWYDNQHVPDVLNIPGFTGAQRFHYVDTPGFPAPKYKYSASYTLETDDVAATLGDMFSRHNTPAMPGSEAMDADSYFALYEAMGPAMTK